MVYENNTYMYMHAARLALGNASCGFLSCLFHTSDFSECLLMPRGRFGAVGTETGAGPPQLLPPSLDPPTRSCCPPGLFVPLSSL